MIIVQLDSEQLGRLIQRSFRKVLEEIPQHGESGEQAYEFLTIKEAAKFLSLTVPTIYSKVSRGELPVMKRSKRLYFSREDLIEYIRAGRKKTNIEINADAETYLRRR